METPTNQTITVNKSKNSEKERPSTASRSKSSNGNSSANLSTSQSSNNSLNDSKEEIKTLKNSNTESSTPNISNTNLSSNPVVVSVSVNSIRERQNWRIHQVYIRQNYKECLKLIEDQIKETNGMCEYPIYVKALIKRHQGEIQESLQLFQAAGYLNPTNSSNLKQVGRSLYLLGKHKPALAMLEEALNNNQEDWEIWHNKGLCYSFLKDYPKAIDCFKKSNSYSKQDCNYIQLGKIYTSKEDFKVAIDTFIEALEFSPENPEILTTLGLLYLRAGENYRAFDYLGNSLTHDPKNPKTILAAGSIIQDHNEVDAALSKYRVAALSTPNSAQLWNNIGMCFFGKQKFVASIASLKKALYLSPFEWIISFNLGLVHLSTGQYASAFHFFSSSINLKPDFASTYMYLAITLNRLDDLENSCSAYEKALELEQDHMFELNYSITLYNRNDIEKAKIHFDNFERLFMLLDEETKNSDSDVLDQRQLLSAALNSGNNNSNLNDNIKNEVST